MQAASDDRLVSTMTIDSDIVIVTAILLLHDIRSRNCNPSRVSGADDFTEAVQNHLYAASFCVLLLYE